MPLQRRARLALAALAVALAGCTSSGSSGSGSQGGSVLSNLFFYGGTTEPALAADPVIEIVDCPPVTVVEGGAAIRSGEGASVRSQVSIAEVARECRGRLDGSVVVKVGIQVRALLGPGGAGARFDTPVTIALKRGESVLTTRTKRVAVTIPPGQVEQSFVVIEDDLVAPPSEAEFEIEVGLGSGPRAAAPARRRGRAKG